MDGSRSQQRAPADPLRAAVDEVTCQEFVELITDYFEGTLTPRTQGLVEEHLVMCDWCVIYAEQMQTTLASLRDLQSEPSIGEPSAAVLAALQNRRDRSE
ncbi:MAG: zf-HC2 domain-containing protein [Solirubrobacteraceae bacterium]